VKPQQQTYLNDKANVIVSIFLTLGRLSIYL
jgi:hypothetical protein